jgi:Abnormal spindle-like microcephaly-assoc'd, ASPM-SPD-2-Hydin
MDASISIGALTVQPGGTGVILAGTGDPNDALDSYYGAGILRSADGGNSWSLISDTSDNLWSFAGEGFAGFAWSTVNPQLVVAAVSQAYEGTLVNAGFPERSYEGLYYSSDSGVSWNLATITDGIGQVVQGPNDLFAGPDGNAATSVVWNPVRQMFVAAVRFHGYYQSTDGMTWTRMAAQPGSGLATSACPTNLGQTGSIDCLIFRGTLAMNPQTGDMFAWTVDAYNQDQGLWQDQCAISGGACGAPNITFAQQWNTQALETNTANGAATINNGDYNLALAAVPAALGQGEDTWLLAGANDLWRCSLAAGCVWRNTTNSATCMSAQVAEFQHALAWSTTNPLEIFIGNDSGLWRSLDAIGETGPVCTASDATHFQNLNGGLGSLTEVESMAGAGISPYTMMTGLGVNGTAGLKSATASTADWPQILGGYGGPVAIDPRNSNNWYVNNQDGVSIYLCSDPTSCGPSNFGTGPVVNDADVGGDGDAMSSPAPFLVDPLDPTQLLIGTCRMWRGLASGIGWSGANAISPILDSGDLNVSCNGDALIRSLAAMPISGGDEVVYVGMYGSLNGGANLPGHVLTAHIDPQSPSMPVWQDLTLNPVTNSPNALNLYGLDISSIFVDTHDPTGGTVYVTVEGFLTTGAEVQTVYGSTDGGAHWASLMANLPSVPVSGVVVDPQSGGTVYLATDSGVYFTAQISSCMNLPSTCWSVFGTGLPEAPVVALSASPTTASAQVLTAATYGRGVWQTPLWTAGVSLTTATATPSSLTFPSQVFGTASGAQIVTLANTGSTPLTTTVIALTGDFSEMDNCQNATVAAGGSCGIQVTFTPTATGSRTGQMTISANVNGGQVMVALSGTGSAAGMVSLTPAAINFGQVEVGTLSSPLQVEAGNSGGVPVPITGIDLTGPFTLSSNACGTSSLAADTDCQLTVEFAPTQPGAAVGTLTLTDGAGTQTVQLSGNGAAPPTDNLNTTSVSFPATAVGQLSAALPVLLSNNGDLQLTSIAVSVSAGFQTSNNCGTQLAGRSACTISVVFVPTQLGIQTGVLTIRDITRAQPQTVALSGTGVAPAMLSVSPTSLNFASQNLNVASTPQTLTITNSGGVAAANVGFGITGPAAGSFATGTTTCASVLASGGSCMVQVIFNPAEAGGSSATLVISSSTLGVKPVSVLLNGAGQAASGLNVGPAQLNFAPTLAGSSSAAQTVTVSNTSSGPASQLAFSITAGFVLTQNTCTASLAPNASCTVGVAFTPTATGLETGALSVSSTSIGNTATVELSGTGAVAAGIQVTPPNVSFATTGVGQTSSPTTVTVTNSGTVTALTNLALTAPAGFQLVSNTCAATLGPGLSCTAGVEFAPTVAGAQTGDLTVTSSTVTNGASVPLQGMGFDFTLTVSGSNTQTVTGGQAASYTLVLTPLNSSSGSFAFACGTLPTNALCLFNPASETLNSGVTGNVTVNVSTGSSASAVRFKGAGVWSVAPLVCGLLLLPLKWKNRRKVMQTIVLVALLTFLVGGVVSCTVSGGGGGGSVPGTGGPGATPAGTYSIPVTVTSTGVTHSVTVTLTVD